MPRASHLWEEYGGTIELAFRRLRRCKYCGKEQERFTHQSWGRVTGYQWLPLAGRCKPDTNNGGTNGKGR